MKTVNTGYYMLWAMPEARMAIRSAGLGERRRGLLHLSNAWRHIGTAAAGPHPAYLSRRAFWARMSCIETAADRARDALAEICMMPVPSPGGTCNLSS
jgi:hypothetical protein